MARFFEARELRRDLHGFGPSPAWLFPDAQFVRKGNSSLLHWEYTIESGFPAALHIHFRHLGIDHRRDDYYPLCAGRRVELRRWIERNLDGDVLYTVDDRSYTVPFDDTVTHGYHVLHFESDAEANHCLLRFADMIETPTLYDEHDELTQLYWQHNGRDQKFYRVYQ